MLIFWRLILGHLLADFTLQADAINRWKRASFQGMAIHCAMHLACYAGLTYPYLGQVWVHIHGVGLPGWACILLVVLGHFLEDQWRAFKIAEHHLADSTILFLWDQCIHGVIIFAVIPGGLHDASSALLPEAWTVLACLFILVTHAATVLVYYVEKDLHGRPFPVGREKRAAMAERLVLALLLLVPGRLWVPLALAWLLAMRVVRSRRLLGLSWESFYLGGGVAAACGLLARLVYYRAG